MSVLINPVRVVFVPYEIGANGARTKRDDLPRFLEPSQVRTFMDRNKHIHHRRGKPVHLQWIEHDEAWAAVEYAKGVGSRGKIH